MHRLERSGHVMREAHPHDGRSTLLWLTARSEEDASAAFAPLVAELERLAGELSEDERAIVDGFLDRVAEAAERHADAVARAADDRARAPLGEPVPGLWG